MGEQITIKCYLKIFKCKICWKKTKILKLFWRNTFLIFLRNTSSSWSAIKSVAGEMWDMLEALRQVGDNQEEAWGKLVKEHFGNPALQVNFPNLITSSSTASPSLIWQLLVKTFALVTKMFSPQEASVQRIQYLVVVVLLPNQYFCQMITTLVAGMIWLTF